jgi:putative endonuclease
MADTIEKRGRGPAGSVAQNKTERGAMFERLARDYLQRHGLRPITENARAAGGEIDLVMRDPRGAVVFVEVRARCSARFGGAAASIGLAKRRKLRRAAAAWLQRWRGPVPPCRFDVVAIEQGRIVWLRDAFGESEG